MGKFDLALSEFSNAISKDKRGSYWYYRRGNVHRDMDKPQKAIEDYTRAIEYSKRPPASWYTARGQTRIDAGAFHQALIDLNTAIRINPQYHKAYLTRGLALRGKDKNEVNALIGPDIAAQAVKDIRTAMRLDGDTAKWIKERLKKAGLFDGAMNSKVTKQVEASLTKCMKSGCPVFD